MSLSLSFFLFLSLSFSINLLLTFNPNLDTYCHFPPPSDLYITPQIILTLSFNIIHALVFNTNSFYHFYSDNPSSNPAEANS